MKRLTKILLLVVVMVLSLVIATSCETDENTIPSIFNTILIGVGLVIGGLLIYWLALALTGNKYIIAIAFVIPIILVITSYFAWGVVRGIILTAFILGFPANEIVLPIILMCYMSSGTLVDISDTVTIKNILQNNGWDAVTALCMLIFTIFHFPCSTTCLTIKKETGSLRYTLAAIAIPTLTGMMLCFGISYISKLIGG